MADSSPFKKVFSTLTLVLIIALVITVVFFFNWLSNHIYTMVWFIACIGCIVWFVYSLLPMGAFTSPNDIDETFD
jgi:hypothetical protein